MKKVFKIENLDCAGCAAKIEESVKKVEGVSNATVSFMTQKLTLEAPDDSFNDILDKVKKVVKKVEPDAVIC